MQSYEKLLAHTYKKDITLIRERCKIAPAFSLCVEGECAIILDERRLNTNAEKTVVLAHEIGHCETGSFYNEKNPLDVYGRHEYQANRWAAQQLIPWRRLQSAFEKHIVEVWDLADHFDVTEDFVKVALDVYRKQGKM